MDGRPSPSRRGLAVLAALPLLALAAVVALFVFWAALWVGEAPDPTVADGDPCCGYPDDWTEILYGAATMLVLSFAVGALVAIAGRLLGLAARGRRPRKRWMAIGPVVALAACGVAEATLILPNVGQGPRRVDCQEHAFNRLGWTSGGSRHDFEARALDRCGWLAGHTPAYVRALLGTPDRDGPAVDGGRVWAYDGLEVHIADGLVLFASAS